jgi:hypothetical protein
MSNTNYTAVAAFLVPEQPIVATHEYYGNGETILSDKS